ncbi:MAG: 3-deoxy-7-phosphoheptulonate synthase [Mycoplasmatales bacterium]
MIIKLNDQISEKEIMELVEKIKTYNCSCEVIKGTTRKVIAVLGDTTSIDTNTILAMDNVSDVKRIQSPYKRASREFQPQNTIVKVGNLEIGGDELIIMGGPCSVENSHQLDTTANYVHENGVQILRGGIVKPRTSPYAFQGLGEEGLKLMEEAREKYGTPIICELMSVSQVEEFGERLDMIQLGARNMQNFDLLKAVGKLSTPVLLKRGLSATIEEWLMSAEYIIAHGNPNVVLCERGIRTFETAYRNITDINAVPMIKKLTHLPIIVDPSHSTGIDWMVNDIALAAVATGADGIMIETHYQREIALSDGPQSLTPTQFKSTVKKIKALHEFMKTLKD